ncbi:MAG: response regulator [Chloroflexi bacterium]|nr:response regulator [Chloroflexota bacterium]
MAEIDRERFDEHVHDALAHLYDHLYLQTHPLAMLLAAGPGEHARGRTLHRVLMEAIESLKPQENAPYRSLAWRKYRYLTLRYVEEMSPGEIVEELGVSGRQSRRDHLEAVSAVASRLWDVYLGIQQTRAAERQKGGPHAPERQDGSLIAAELARLGSLDPAGPVSVYAAAEGALATVAALARARGTTLANAVSPAPESPALTINRTVLRQILIGLLLYALDRAPGGHVELGATPTDHGVEIRVVAASPTRGEGAQLPGEWPPCVGQGAPSPPTPSPTQGRGGDALPLPPEWGPAQERRQGVEGASGPIRRTGPLLRAQIPPSRSVGERAWSEGRDRLAAAHRLARMHGGEVQLIWEAESGVELVVSLPAARPAMVLVIEDNPDMRSLLKRYLTAGGYRVAEAATASGAIERIQGERPVAVALDVMMPAQDGWEILQALKSHPDSRDVPVIVCSVLRERELALSLGAAELLPKPITQRTLLEALARCRAAGRSSAHPD